MASIHADRCRHLETRARKGPDVCADRGTVETESRYNGRSIRLWSTPEDEGTWACEYTIVEFRPTGSFCESGYLVGRFTRRDEAEAAALAVAQGVIDTRDPVGEPDHSIGPGVDPSFVVTHRKSEVLQKDTLLLPKMMDISTR